MTITEAEIATTLQNTSRAGPPPRPGRLPATIIVAGLNNAPLAGARLVLPMIALSMGIGPALVGLMASMFTLAPMFLTVAFGRWVDRSGPLTPILFSTGLIVAAAVLFEAHPSQSTLLAMAALIGAGGMFSHVAATRAVGEVGPPSARARHIGYLVVAYSVFQFLGPVIAGSSYEWGGGEAAVLSLGGFAALSFLVLATPWHNFSRWPTENRPAAAGRTRELWAVPGLGKWLLTLGVFGGVQAIYPFVLSLHVVAQGLSAADAGMMLGAFAIGSLVSRMTVGLVTRWLRGPLVVTLALIGGGLAYAALPFMQTLLPLMTLSAAMGFAIGLGSPIVLALIYDTAPPARVNESIGLGMAITNLLQTALPLTLGLVASGLGIGAMVWALAFAMLVCAALTGRT
ncbi:MAG: MFS transporter [Paracoccus sp. BP8]|uniref:MFS transporter n=1 Tax=Paracoccus sp. J39 TaxID=935848 RepID=UPI00048B137A|nr:MFS transporter [Paracoccus sp. J39]RQP04111.1 MAG: MFS transporter [Paracoccus sp. BP8]